MRFVVISEQLAVVLRALILGAILATAYDMVRIVRMLLCSQGVKKLKISERIPTVTLFKGAAGEHLQMFFANITDIVYSVFASAAFCIFLYHMNNGIFRWYLLLSSVAGFALYRLSVGVVVKSAFGYITGGVRTLFGFLMYLLSRPAVLLVYAVKRLAAPIGEVLRRRRMIRKTEKIRKSLRNEVEI